MDISSPSDYPKVIRALVTPGKSTLREKQACLLEKEGHVAVVIVWPIFVQAITLVKMNRQLYSSSL